MTVPDFTVPFRELAAVFDKPLQGREALAAGYYRGFQELSGRDWQELCREAAIKLDRFPSIHQMKELAESLGFFHARKATLHVAFPWIITVCSCGNAWAVSRKAPDSQQAAHDTPRASTRAAATGPAPSGKRPPPAAMR